MQFQVIIAVMAMAVAVYAAKSPNLIGEFEAKDGATCTLLKLDMGDNTHSIVMECNCKDPAGYQQSYACTYHFEGDFEKCPDEEKVYRQTKREMAGMCIQTNKT